MTLGQCLDNLTMTLPYYYSFAASLNNISLAVNFSHSRLSNIQMITHNILSQESKFKVELGDLQKFYNQLAARANALSTWMGEERQIRNQLAVFYNGLIVLHTEEKEKLAQMRVALGTALAVMGDINRRTSLVLQGVANAAIATRPWAMNVTTSADQHTLRLDSLASAMEWRIQQMQASRNEQLKMAKVANAVALHYKNASLTQQASQLVMRLST